MADTALLKKFLIKSGMKVSIVKAPAGYADKLAPLPEGAQLAKPGMTADFALLFVKNRQDVASATGILKSLKPDGVFWIAYPKGGAKAGTDLNRDILWDKMKSYGLAGVAMVAIDDTWAAMRFRPAAKVGK